MSEDQSPNQPIVIVPSSPRYAAAMEDLQHAVYGSTRERPNGALTEKHFLHHQMIFPEGQFVALAIQPDGSERVVGLTCSMRLPFDPDHPFLEAWDETISGGWLTRHDPRAKWMYGVESAVHPAYQGHGIGGKLMEARFKVAKHLNLRGMVAGSALISYYKVADSVSADEYVRGVVDGRYFDNNLSKQIKKGFHPIATIPNYLDDQDTRGWGAVIVWDNPAYNPHHQTIKRVSRSRSSMLIRPQHPHGFAAR